MTRPTRRSRRAGAPLTVIFWRDIPAQVNASVGDDTAKRLLAPRFQHAIDRAAHVAGLTETERYIAQWRRVPTDPTDPDDLAASADALAASLETDYPRARLEALVAAGGLEPEPVGGSPT
ncbi:MAG: virulence factor [Acidimicrobiales bacterium]